MPEVRTVPVVRRCDGCGEPVAACHCLVLPLSEVIERLLGDVAEEPEQMQPVVVVDR